MFYTLTLFFISLTIYLLVSPADNFCKQFGPSQDQQNVSPDLEIKSFFLFLFFFTIAALKSAENFWSNFKVKVHL